MNVRELIENGDYKKITQIIKRNEFVDVFERENFMSQIWNIAENGPREIRKILTEVIRKSGDAYCISFFANNMAKKFPEVSIDDLVQALIKTGDFLQIYEFARFAPGAPVDELAAVIATSKDIELTWRFVEYVKNVNIKELVQAVITTGDAKYICEFAKKIKGAPINDLAQGIITTGDAKYIYEFAKCFVCYLEEVEIINLAQAVIVAGNAKYIYEFAINVEYAPTDELIQAIINLGDFKYMCLFVKDNDFVKETGIDANKIFIAIIKSLEIETLPEVKIENILVKFAEAGVFDMDILIDFLVYWAQQISIGVNIFEEPTQIGEDSIGGRQFVKEQ